MESRWPLLLSLVLLTGEALHGVEGIEFMMLFMTKCISEEIPANTQVELEYTAYDKQDATRDVGTKLMIEDPKGQTVYDGTGDRGKISFKSKDEGDYKACFNVASNVVASRVKLRLEWRLGVAQVDWDAIAKKEHLEQIDVYMERFKTTIKNLNDELKEIRKKEQDMREITEGTNTRVSMFSLSCVVVCVAITISQIWYLRRFFTKKKII